MPPCDSVQYLAPCKRRPCRLRREFAGFRSVGPARCRVAAWTGSEIFALAARGVPPAEVCLPPWWESPGRNRLTRPPWSANPTDHWRSRPERLPGWASPRDRWGFGRDDRSLDDRPEWANPRRAGCRRTNCRPWKACVLLPHPRQGLKGFLPGGLERTLPSMTSARDWATEAL